MKKSFALITFTIGCFFMLWTGGAHINAKYTSSDYVHNLISFVSFSFMVGISLSIIVSKSVKEHIVK